MDGLVIDRVGAVRSILTVAVAVAVLEAVSSAVPETPWLAPSVVSVSGEVQLESGAPPGIQVKDTVTDELFQPLAFA